jgi:hypothetical protein
MMKLKVFVSYEDIGCNLGEVDGDVVAESESVSDLLAWIWAQKLKHKSISDRLHNIINIS